MPDDTIPHEVEGQRNPEGPEKYEPPRLPFFRTHIQPALESAGCMFKNTIIKFFALSNTYGAGITALATMGLAVITLFYLMATREYVEETRKQRELMQAQFVAANSPEIFIQYPRPFYHQDKDTMATQARIINSGKAVENMEFLFVLFCCQDISKKYDDLRFLPWAMRIPRIGQNQDWGHIAAIYDQDKIRFESAASDISNILIFAYAQLTYTKPALLIGDKPERVTDTASFWWNPRFKQWHGLPTQLHERLKLFIERKTEEELAAIGQPSASQ